MSVYSIATSLFGENKVWNKLKRGFITSTGQNTNATVFVYHTEPPGTRQLRQQLLANHYKLKKWRDVVYEAQNPVVLMDTDIIVLDDIDECFSDHITLTSRGHRWCNAGVVFVNPTEESRKFMDAWCDMDKWLSMGAVNYNGDSERLIKAWAECGVRGQNQTALRKIYDDWSHIVQWVPGEIYNLDPFFSDSFTNETKVIHVKDSLRTNLGFHLSGLRTKRVHRDILKKIEKYYL